MSILVDKKTRLVVQGITGGEGSFHTQQMIEYGTKVVAGVTPGKGGTEFLGIQVYNTVEQAVKEQKANTSVIFVPPAFAIDAILEAASSGIKVIVCITEGIPELAASSIASMANAGGTKITDVFAFCSFTACSTVL